MADEENIHNLLEEMDALDKKILEQQKISVDKEKYMKLLHEYNDLKDATQILIGSLANLKGVTVAELHKKYELPTSE